MRSLLPFVFLAAFLPACSDPGSVDHGSGGGNSSNSGGSDGTGGSGGSGGAGGSGGIGGSGGGSEVPSESIQLVCGLIQEACERQVACGHPVLNTAADVEKCVEAQHCELIAEVLASPDYELDTDAVADCSAALKAASCGAVVTQGLDIAFACQHYIVGTRTEGQTCRGGTISDCKLGLVCDSNLCPGTCVKDTMTECAEGSCGSDGYCGTNGECQPRALIGQACNESDLDFSNLRDNVCAQGSHCENFVCKADLPLGATCAGAAPTACGPTATCQCANPMQCSNPGDFTCIPVGAKGAACNWTYDCEVGLYCDFSGPSGGVCANRGAKGAVCNDSMGACQHPLSCINGTCGTESDAVAELPLLEEGASCVFEGSCPLGTTCTCVGSACQDKTCQAAPLLGESCADQLTANYTPFACAEGLCDIFGSQSCVASAPTGAACAPDGFTFGCSSGVCLNGKCAAFDDLRCPE